MGTQKTRESKQAKQKTPTFLLELPLQVDAGQAKRIRGHLEAGRQFYNAVLSAGQRRLRQMRADPAWREARAIPQTHLQERRAAFAALRERYGFSEYAFHELAKGLRVSWLAEHLDAVLAQTLATRAYRALNRVCVGKARRVRFKSRGRGLSSLENKRNDTGLRFVLEPQENGRTLGFLLWHDDRLPTLIDPDDPVVAHGLAHPVKYARLVRRSASSPRAQGADKEGERYFVQLALCGLPHHKPKHRVGTDTVGLDLGPASIAIVPRQAEARLEKLGAELRPDARVIRRLQRRMERQRRAANPEHYDERGRPRKRGKGAPQESALAHDSPDRGCGPHYHHREAFLPWLASPLGQERGTSRPRDVDRTPQTHRCKHGRHPARGPHTLDQTVPILSRLRQVCSQATLTALAPVPVRHRAGAARPVLRVSGRLSRSSKSVYPLVRPVCRSPFEGAGAGGEARLKAVHERVIQRAKEGQVLPRSMGIPRAGARLPQSRSEATPELLFLSSRGKVEAWKRRPEPPVLEPGESSDLIFLHKSPDPITLLF
jgi:hypothetical protein